MSGPDGKRVVLTEEQAALLHRAVLAYNRNLRRIVEDYPFAWTDDERSQFWQERHGGAELAYLLGGGDDDYEFQRITLEWSDEPFPDVELRPEEGE